MMRFEEISLRPQPPCYPQRCPYCPTRAEPLDQHLVSEHADLLFHCSECDAYIDRKDLVLHMSLHAVEYTGNDKDRRRTEKTKPKEANVKKLGKLRSSEREATRKPEGNPPDEFSDQSDAEYEFGPLPESVFEAIEDSQDSQPNEIEVSSNAENEPPDKIQDTPKSDTDKEDTTCQKVTKKIRTCPICGKVYKASSSYFYHMKHFHRQSKDHECDVCKKKFGTKACLSEHKTIHTQEYPYQCKQCDKRFRSKASFYIHEQTHNGVKSWSCSQCHISFRWRTHLVRHMKRHNAEKAHVCEACGRRFSVRCDLLRHARTHAAGSHACDKCGTKFAQVRYLKVHMARKHATGKESMSGNQD